jgi:DNA adenine methylase
MNDLFEKPLRAAPFSYWGSKVRMAPWIIARLPHHEHFVETCAGSAAVLALKPRVIAESVNDVYEEVVNFFRVLRDPKTAADLIDMVAFTPYSLAEFRGAAAPRENDVERAWAFFVRMQMAVVAGRTGWSYGVAAASAHKANKPGRWATMPEHLRLAAQRFERVQVTSWPVEECLERLDAPGTLHFVDPPYLEDSRPTSTGASSAYKHDAFDHASFVKAALGTRHAEVVVSHYPHPFYDDGPWEVLGDYESHRNIPNGKTRSVAHERLYRLRRSTTDGGDGR